VLYLRASGAGVSVNMSIAMTLFSHQTDPACEDR
jgi:hypothetical protein